MGAYRLGVRDTECGSGATHTPELRAYRLGPAVWELGPSSLDLAAHTHLNWGPSVSGLTVWEFPT